jgi:hypothetical protein
MADTIPLHYATEFSTNWIHRTQQMKAYLSDWVESESFMGERKRYDRLQKQTSSLRTERKAQTPVSDTSNDSRWCYRQTYDLANVLAEEDARNLAPLVLPSSAYVESHTMAYNRDCDQTAINVAGGTIMTGETGTTPGLFPTSTNLIGKDGTIGSDTGTGTGMTITKLISATEILNEADLMDKRERVLVVSPYAISSMLAQTRVTSADYATLRALMNGEINTFMGFTWKISNLLPVSSNIRTCLAWIKGAIKIVKGGMRTSIDRLPETSNATQIYSSWDLSGTRVYDEGVIKINIDESVAIALS